MLKLWERLRGYDKWIETTATLRSADLETIPHAGRYGNVSYTYDSYDTITWADQKGETHTADFRVPDDSPIYQLIEGNKAKIRYDPADPDRFYYPDLCQTRVNTVLKRTGFALLFLAILSIFFALHIWVDH